MSYTKAPVSKMFFRTFHEDGSYTDSEPIGLEDVNRPLAVDGRRVGNTTRLVDYYVQRLFKRLEQDERGMRVVDHYYGESSSLATKLLFQTLLKRLDMEHHLNTTTESRHGKLLVDSQRFTIKLLPNA